MLIVLDLEWDVWELFKTLFKGPNIFFAGKLPRTFTLFLYPFLPKIYTSFLTWPDLLVRNELWSNIIHFLDSFHHEVDIAFYNLTNVTHVLRKTTESKNQLSTADAKSTPSYFLGPTFLGILMQLSDLWWQYRSEKFFEPFFLIP